MVNDPAEYIWSSYQINALGKTSQLCIPHHLDAEMISDIRQATNKGMVLGSDTFQDQIEKLTGKVSILRK